MADVIFISGATSGFGAATARLFAGRGWKIVATGRRTERLEELAGEFEPGIVAPITMDLTDRDSIRAAVDAVPDTHRPVKCLFNNGGLALGTGKIPDIDLDDWKVMVETNTLGLAYLTQFALDLVKAAGPGASIINVGSIAGRFPYAGGNVYGASKAFTRQFSYNLRTDLAGTGVRVTSLEPGMAKSEFTLVRTKGDAEANEKLYEGVEPIRPEDVAETVWWLANQPAHININSIEIMPVAQVPQGPLVVRD